ncbi:hypothetical protein OG342_04710 [Streptomyces bobili]|uniref:hypothetical protein n=1 Tax=Streptomyces bobili TaxID=67280 RepID=UPI00225B043B|nr:hypothetical protein [Streptomyces bobili]MCX5522169.1 hypothetical protein [Streptomyces bobili]
MTGAWGVALGIIGSLIAATAMVAAAVFTSRATKAAARMTAEAQRTTAAVQAEPQQRAEDRAAFEAIKSELREELTTTRDEVRSLRSLVRAFAWYVGELTAQMRDHRIEPPAPPERVDEYNRTGV